MRQQPTGTHGSMTNPPKYLFDTDFSEPEEPEVVVPEEPVIPMIPVSEHESLLKQAKAKAFEEGRTKALAEHQEKQETLLTAEAAHLSETVAQLMQTLDDHRDAMEKNAVSLAFLVARRLCAHLIARQPLAETVALVSECLGPLRKAPHLVIRIAEKDVEALKKRVDPIVHEKGFEGRLVILGEPDIGRGDCHIEWADGGIQRDRKALEAAIDASIKGYLGARGQQRQEPAKSEKPSEAPVKEDTDA